MSMRELNLKIGEPSENEYCSHEKVCCFEEGDYAFHWKIKENLHFIFNLHHLDNFIKILEEMVISSNKNRDGKNIEIDDFFGDTIFVYNYKQYKEKFGSINKNCYFCNTSVAESDNFFLMIFCRDRDEYCHNAEHIHVHDFCLENLHLQIHKFLNENKEKVISNGI